MAASSPCAPRTPAIWAPARFPSCHSRRASQSPPASTTSLPVHARPRGRHQHEVVFVLERMVDTACRRHGFDRLEVRRRNLVPPKAMPYRNPLGLVYDSGDYPASLRRAAELGDWTGFAVRRAEARRRGRCRGIGVAMSIELNT